ncbi:glycoside hydrolase family 36 protein [Lentzea nigeriaca]|uniref:glycoside hydrolase family 36 protein n=1 Tax=Lentzea nigeriaca TaxID=1128665 RepID=UPI0019574AF1|nr:glycoside hydrolase family 36 protein [Lentzea nigeriaca]MBM7864244.1 alpha-galactosidase [Lentzea nigeriaca]
MTTIRWGHEGLTWEFDVTDGKVRRRGSSLPLVEVTAANHGRHWSSNRLVDTVIGAGLRYRTHRELSEKDFQVLVIELHDEDSGLTAEVTYRSPDGVPVVRGEVVVRNEGSAPLRLESVTSLVTGGLPAGADVLWAENDWNAECRWRRQPVRLSSPDRNGRLADYRHKSAFTVAGRGVWSSCGHLPMGGLTDSATGESWVWQIEHNGGGWSWECGELDGTGYVALSGPVDLQHGWNRVLAPGEEFRTVPVALAFSAEGGPDGAFAALTRYRRATRRPHPDHEGLPVIFNDYMNCLMGDPTTAKLLPLIDAAADAGAEYFVIDAGWYAEEGESWWGTVGAWQPSRSRFPGGLPDVLTRIRERGMVPGLWLEPEVIGVDSPLARSLPDEAFFRRDGVRVSDCGRHQLDLRHPAARAHLDEVVDRLVGDWGVGYLKLDYNINPGSGTSTGSESPADGLLGHNRAHLDWLDGVLDRYPDLVVENCASGGMRIDHASLSRLQLQSTSDQQNLDRYVPIAASSPTAITPEQGAVWSYPLPEHSLDEVAVTMANALLGRIHLSGNIPDLAPEARALVHEAVAVYKSIRADLPRAVPFWPLGLPGWEDPWIALALCTSSTTYLTVWRRPGGEDTVVVRLPHLSDVDLQVLYPADSAATAWWRMDTAELTVTLPAAPSAVVYRLTTRGADR